MRPVSAAAVAAAAARVRQGEGGKGRVDPRTHPRRGTTQAWGGPALRTLPPQPRDDAPLSWRALPAAATGAGAACPGDAPRPQRLPRRRGGEWLRVATPSHPGTALAPARRRGRRRWRPPAPAPRRHASPMHAAKQGPARPAPAPPRADAPRTWAPCSPGARCRTGPLGSCGVPLPSPCRPAAAAAPPLPGRGLAARARGPIRAPLPAAPALRIARCGRG